MTEPSTEVGRAPGDDVVGPAEIARWILDAAANEIPLTETGALRLAALAYGASVSADEGRYPRFVIFVPQDIGVLQAVWLSRFPESPIPSAKDLAQLAQTVPAKPFALVITERGGNLIVHGIARVEFAALTSGGDDPLARHRVRQGIYVGIDGPGAITLVKPEGDGAARAGGVRAARWDSRFDATNSPSTFAVARAAADRLVLRVDPNAPTPMDRAVNTIASVWTRVLSRTRDLAHGGCHIVMPEGDKWDRAALLDRGRPCEGPDVGRLAVDAIRPVPPEGPVSGRLHVLDAADVSARLSALDGCVLHDLTLSARAFGVKLRVEGVPEECDRVLVDGRVLDRVRLDGLGMRHKSAAAFCQRVPGAHAFVVSQDGDIRSFYRAPEGPLTMHGPMTVLPVLSSVP